MTKISLICLAHNNLSYNESFKKNAVHFSEKLKGQGDVLEVIYATSGKNRVYPKGKSENNIFKEFYSENIDMVDKIRRCVDIATGDVCMLWTIDDTFNSDLACRYFDKIKSGRYVCSGGARKHGDENFIKLSKGMVDADNVFVRISNALEPYDSFIYFLSRKDVMVHVINILLKWTKDFYIYEYANFFEIGYCILTLIQGKCYYEKMNIFHYSSVNNNSLGGMSLSNRHIRENNDIGKREREVSKSFKKYIKNYLRSEAIDKEVRDKANYIVGMMLQNLGSNVKHNILYIHDNNNVRF